MLLEDLLKHTDADHADEAPLKEALARVCEVAMHINEEKRHLDEVEKLRAFVQRFVNCESEPRRREEPSRPLGALLRPTAPLRCCCSTGRSLLRACLRRA